METESLPCFHSIRSVETSPKVYFYWVYNLCNKEQWVYFNQQGSTLGKKKKILCCQAINSYGNECELGKQEKNWFRAIIGLQVMPAISGNHKSQLRWNNKVGWRWALWKDLKSNHHSESDPEQEGRGLLEQLTGPSDQWQHQRWRIHFGCFTYLYYII